jgi:uncharacterized membrane protein
MSQELTVFLLATLPLGELRVTIPLALEQYHFSFWLALLLSVGGVMLAVVILLLILGPSVELLRKNNLLNRFFNLLFSHTRKKHSQKIKVWGSLALVFISAIPVPVVGGAWTAVLVAFIFNLPRVRSALLILVGTILSGFIVLAITQGITTVI